MRGRSGEGRVGHPRGCEDQGRRPEGGSGPSLASVNDYEKGLELGRSSYTSYRAVPFFALYPTPLYSTGAPTVGGDRREGEQSQRVKVVRRRPALAGVSR